MHAAHFIFTVLKVLRRYVPDDVTEDEYEVLELDRCDDGDAIQAYLKQLTGASSVSDTAGTRL